MKSIAVIEITNKVARLIVGNVLDDKPVIIYQTERPIEGMVARGEIVDFEGLTNVLKSLRSIQDPNLHLKLTVPEVTLVIPPLGLEVFQADKTTNIVSPTAIIEQIDISNVLSLVSKEKVPSGSEIVDIVPDVFITETSTAYEVPPVGQKSNSLTLRAKVLAMPSHIIDSYRKVVEAADIRTRRILVSPYALTTLARNDVSFPQHYILLDMGAMTTTVSLVGYKSIISCNVLMLGANDLALQIADEFEVDPMQATELAELYGISTRELSFEPNIVSGVNRLGEEKNFTTKDLNRVINDFLDNYYFKQLDVVLTTLLTGCSTKVSKLPIVISGGFSNLKGFKEILVKKFGDHDGIYFLTPTSVGVRDAKYSCSVGALIASSKYRGALSDQRAKVSQIERVNSKETE